MEIDIKEQKLYEKYPEILRSLLYDHTTDKYILWATDNYISYGQNYAESCEIKPELITGKYKNVIQPRVSKTAKEQEHRTKDKAEVFTPTWVCKQQNDLIDKNWFEDFDTLKLKDSKNWTDYIALNRLEICCGEGPYIVNRYDTVSGKEVEFEKRTGFLDRKLRLINKFSEGKDEWIKHTFIALKSTFGYEYQGDSLLIARENVLFSVMDAFFHKFNESLPVDTMITISEIISWNIWQMDGLKFVIPNSCVEEESGQMSLFDIGVEKKPCKGCTNGDPYSHTGTYCQIKDWHSNKIVKFVSMLKENGYESI